MHTTFKKLADLENEKKTKIAKIEQKLEKKKNALIEKRKEELFIMFESYSLLSIDDNLLKGFLSFVQDEQNKDHPLIHEWKNLDFKKVSKGARGRPKKNLSINGIKN